MEIYLLCPAWGKTCDGCKMKNHFKSVCKKTVQVVHREPGIDHENDDEYKWMAPIDSENHGKLTALLIANGNHIRFHLDTGSDTNAVCQKYVRKCHLRPMSVKLAMLNKTRLLPLGEAMLHVENPRSLDKTQVTFAVIPDEFMCLLGSKICQEMGFVSINRQKFVAKVEVEQEHKSLGDLGEVKLHMDTRIRGRVLQCRCLPLALKDKFEKR